MRKEGKHSFWEEEGVWEFFLGSFPWELPAKKGEFNGEFERRGKM